MEQSNGSHHMTENSHNAENVLTKEIPNGFSICDKDINDTESPDVHMSDKSGYALTPT